MKTFEQVLAWIEEVRHWTLLPIPTQSTNDRVEAHFMFYDVPLEVLLQVGEKYQTKVYLGRDEQGRQQVKATTSISLTPPLRLGRVSVQLVENDLSLKPKPTHELPS